MESVEDQNACRAGKQQRLNQRRQRLRLAMAKAVHRIGRPGGVMHPEHSHERGGHVDDGIDEGRQQTQRIRYEPSRGFRDDQQDGDAETGVAGAAPKLPFGRRTHRLFTRVACCSSMTLQKDQRPSSDRWFECCEPPYGRAPRCASSWKSCADWCHVADNAGWAVSSYKQLAHVQGCEFAPFDADADARAGPAWTYVGRTWVLEAAGA